jgi:hypothetical protein
MKASLLVDSPFSVHPLMMIMAAQTSVAVLFNDMDVPFEK